MVNLDESTANNHAFNKHQLEVATINKLNTTAQTNVNMANHNILNLPTQDINTFIPHSAVTYEKGNNFYINKQLETLKVYYTITILKHYMRIK